MKLSFLQTVQGHEIEFARLLYPLRYEIFVSDSESNILKLTLTKDNDGVWTIREPANVPGFIAEISLPIHEAIEANENSEHNTD